MKRRQFTAATAALLVSPRRSRAQGTRRRLGVLLNAPMDSALVDGLRKHGWIDGQNLIIEYRHGQSQEHLSALAAELVALSPDLLFAAGSQPVVALKSATASIPIVFVGVADPVGLGLVQSLSRPGGNITGFAAGVPGFAIKELELLRELVPAASKIAVLAHPGNPSHRWVIAEEFPRAARQFGVALAIVEATKAEELDIAFASAATQHAAAMVVLLDNFHWSCATQLIALAAKHRLPAMYLVRFFVTKGGLISYGLDLSDLVFRAGGHLDKILKGAKPSDLPVELPTKYQLVINMKTAKALGLTVPLSLLARADEVIE